MKIPVYPDDFYDFSDGVDVDNKEINRWIKECIKDLEQDITTTYSSISSGNTKVLVYKIFEQNGDNYYYQINIIKSYSKAETGLYEFKKSHKTKLYKPTPEEMKDLAELTQRHEGFEAFGNPEDPEDWEDELKND